MVAWWAGEWFETAGKASMTPHADDGEKGPNCLLITVYCHVQREICLPFMVQCVPRYPPATETVTARTVFHCEFVVGICSPGYTASRRLYRDREGISGRGLDFNGLIVAWHCILPHLIYVNYVGSCF